ncbi:hypothetical protein LIQ05_18950 [Blautia glucerasea]|uniref:hypothetical protein n=1 Tax=Blautia glucerasea TaxID=536633 RepID=UPI001D01FB44|nr:hypothetical protein [Blautia glucerasea]MCB5389024.1 hypothetical protein [Blautia glucerasea]MCB5423469.1 hypothetical protein [Blautia luti]
MKKKIIAVISGTAILIIAAGSIYGKFESSHKESEPDVVGTFSVNRDENITVVANREDIEDGESVMTAEYRPVEYGKDYDVVNNPDKFQLYIDGKEIK